MKKRNFISLIVLTGFSFLVFSGMTMLPQTSLPVEQLLHEHRQVPMDSLEIHFGESFQKETLKDKSSDLESLEQSLAVFQRISRSA